MVDLNLVNAIHGDALERAKNNRDVALSILAHRIVQLEGAFREIVQAYPNPEAVAHIIASSALKNIRPETVVR